MTATVPAAGGPGRSAVGELRQVRSPAPEMARQLPGLVRVARARAAMELRVFLRNKSSLIFTIGFPVLLLVVLGSILRGPVGIPGVTLQQVIVTGIIPVGVASVAFNGLGITMAIERDDGTVRRIGATPMPRAAYFLGKAVLVVVTGFVETALLIGLSVVLFGLRLPETVQPWLWVGWVLGLGAVGCALLAIAYSWVIPNARSAAALVTPVFVLLQFVSGVFFPLSSLPGWMQQIGALFPLKWMVQGLQSALLPDAYQVAMPAGSWEVGKTAAVLAGWCVGGVVLCLLTFRWRDPKVR